MATAHPRAGFIILTSLLCMSCATVPPPPVHGESLDELDPLPPPSAGTVARPAREARPDAAVVEQQIGRRPSRKSEAAETQAPMTPEEVVEAVSKEVSGKEAWATYQIDQRFDCVGPLSTLEKAFGFRSGESNVTIEGWRALIERSGDEKRTVKIGVLSAIKDKYPQTLQNLTEFLAWFGREGVDVVVLNGDVAYESDDLLRSLELVARTPLPIWVMPGNSDPVAGFNLALRKLSGRYPNLMNASFVRLLQIGPVALISLPGYYDPEFIPGGGGCQYYADDLTGIEELSRRAEGLPVLVSHGPPKGNHPNAIDFAFDAGNVGDARMNQTMKRARIRLAIFGHILEAGGRAVRGQGGKAVTAGRWSNSLWVNAGSSSSVEQELHDGDSHRGMAAIVEVDGAGKRARYSFEIRRP